MLKKILILFIISLRSLTISAQQMPVPKGYEVLDTVSGDLDHDGKKELVIAYNTAKTDDPNESIPRALIIYKLQGKEWTVWKKSEQALYGSRDGGMMGDPFGEIEIKSGILLISQNGGSSWKWGHTDKYRFQNGEFYLIGYVGTYGKPCEYWTDEDFNLSTGKLVVKKEYETCKNGEQEINKQENETVFKKGIKITLQNRSEKEIKIVTPKYKHEVYVAVKNE